MNVLGDNNNIASGKAVRLKRQGFRNFLSPKLHSKTRTMSSKPGTRRDSDTNDDSSDEDASNKRRDHGRSKEKRKKHKKHKQHKKAKKHKKERHSSESDSRSKSGSRAAVDSDSDLDAPPSTNRKTVQAVADSPADRRHFKSSKHNGKEVESHKQISSRWDSSGEGEHSRQKHDSKRTRTYRSDSRGRSIDGGRTDRDRSNHEQSKSARPSQSGKSAERNAHHFDNREKDRTAHQGNRNGNHYSRGFDKHESNQRYRADSSNRSSYNASSSRDNEVSSSSRDTGQQRIHQRNRDLSGEQQSKQSETDKYGTGSGRKRRHGDSPYKQPIGRGDMPSQRRGTFPVKQEKVGRSEEEAQFKWGKDTGSKSKPSKTNGNEDRTSESMADSAADSAAPIEKEKPNFGLSGKLTAETNTVHGVVIAYAEPPGARKPKRRWRLYPFKGEQALPTLYIHRQSCYLIGRDRKVCDIPVDHPSCSKQHAVLQYRLVPYERVDGTKSQCVRPYIIDLESSNGTFVNNKQIESKRYLELREKDVLKFGFSSREYVLLHENSKEDNEEDEGYDASPVKTRADNDSIKAETK